jgi:hypothetical protein
MIRDHRGEKPRDVQARETAEAELDKLIGIIRFGCARLMAWLAEQVANSRTLTAAQARIFLIATGVDDEAMNGWHENPALSAQNLLGRLKLGPGRPEEKLTMMARNMLADTAWRPGPPGEVQQRP